MDKRVFVHRNEVGSDGKVVCVEPKDSLAKFKRAASKKLGLKVRYINPPNAQEESMITVCTFTDHTASKENISGNWG
jgi:hypothetical protein